MSKKQPKELRCESLLMAAVEEFMEKGYDGASMDAIAKRAGVSKGGLYYHFPSKEGLLMEANRKLSEPILQMIKKACLNKNAVDGLNDYIQDYLEYWVAHPRELSFFFLSMSKALESSVLIGYYREYTKQYTAFFVDMFEKAKQTGEIDIRDSKAYGLSLMGALDGILTYAVMNPEQNVTLLAKRFMQVWLKSERNTKQ